MVFEAAKAEVFEEGGSGAVGVGTANNLVASGLFDQAAFEEGLHNTVHGNAADLLDLSASEWLAVSDDGEGFERWLGKARRTDFVANEGLDPRRVIGLAGELPCTSDAHEPITAAKLLVLARELFERFGEVVDRDFLEFPGRGFFRFFGGGNQQFAQVLWGQRVLRGKQNRFENRFQFHYELIGF